MTHYGIEQWVDFSRKIGDSEERGRMIDHLASGCTECDRLSTLTTKLVVTCGNPWSMEDIKYAVEKRGMRFEKEDW